MIAALVPVESIGDAVAGLPAGSTWALLGEIEAWRAVYVVGPVRRVVVMVPGEGELRVGFDLALVRVQGEDAPRWISVERLDWPIEDVHARAVRV